MCERWWKEPKINVIIILEERKKTERGGSNIWRDNAEKFSKLLSSHKFKK